MKKSTNELCTRVDGAFRLCSTDYVFIKGNTVDSYSAYHNKRTAPKARIVLRSMLKPRDRVYYCNRCHTLPAYQLDVCYEENIHDFTYCKVCLEELNELFAKKEEEE